MRFNAVAYTVERNRLRPSKHWLLRANKSIIIVAVCTQRLATSPQSSSFSSPSVCAPYHSAFAFLS